MYENEYENYMRSVLGYSSNNTTYNVNSFPYRSNNNIKNNYEHLYPDIYKVLKPMVNKVCSNVRSMDISTEIIDDMANEIYNNIESDTLDIRHSATGTENSLKSNENGVREKSDYRLKGNSDSSCKGANTASNNQRGNSSTIGNHKSNSSDSTTDKNTREQNRDCCGNPTLKDLIKILIITQLISNGQNRPPKPPPPYPPRPNYRDLESPPYYNNNLYGEF
ncbi:MAG: hypothetical protein J6J36_05190 [Clostridia bacterium]|nr:hypothetical protein [Clostridia bacterium]